MPGQMWEEAQVPGFRETANVEERTAHSPPSVNQAAFEPSSYHYEYISPPLLSINQAKRNREKHLPTDLHTSHLGCFCSSTFPRFRDSDTSAAASSTTINAPVAAN